jgi:hypothetical protein
MLRFKPKKSEELKSKHDIEFQAAVDHIKTHSDDIKSQEIKRSVETEKLLFVSIDKYFKNEDDIFTNVLHDINLMKELLKDLLFFHRLSAENTNLKSKKNDFYKLLDKLKININKFISIINESNKILISIKNDSNEEILNEIKFIQCNYDYCLDKCNIALSEYKRLKDEIESNKIRGKNYLYCFKI